MNLNFWIAVLWILVGLVLCVIVNKMLGGGDGGADE